MESFPFGGTDVGVSEGSGVEARNLVSAGVDVQVEFGEGAGPGCPGGGFFTKFEERVVIGSGRWLVGSEVGSESEGPEEAFNVPLLLECVGGGSEGYERQAFIENIAFGLREGEGGGNGGDGGVSVPGWGRCCGLFLGRA